MIDVAFLDKYVEEPENLINNEEIQSHLFELTTEFFKNTSYFAQKIDNNFNFQKFLLTNGKTQNIINFNVWNQINKQNKQVVDIYVSSVKKNEDDELINETEDMSEGLLHSYSEYDDENYKQETKEVVYGSNDELPDYSDFAFDDKNGIQFSKITEEEFAREEEEMDYDTDGNYDDIKKHEEDEISNILLGKNQDVNQPYIRYEDLYGDKVPEEINEEEDYDNEEEDVAGVSTGGEEDVLSINKSEIERIEQQMLADKPYFLMGETFASGRTKDALLDIDLDFNMRNDLPPNPPTTEELNVILTTRIESMLFDDVVRKKKVTENKTEEQGLSGIKSKLSLVEEYEQMAMSNANLNEPEKFTNEQKEALEQWRELEHELNRFTERRAISKKPRQRALIVTSNAILDVEDKPDPVKAPEEIMAPVGTTRQLKSDIERSSREKDLDRQSRKKKHAAVTEKKDAAKGVLYNETGKDGKEVQIEKDVEKLIKGQHQDIEVYQPGQAIPNEKVKKKVNKKNPLI